MTELSPLATLISNLEEDATLELVRQMMANNDDPISIIHECNLGLREIGERYERREYFLAALIMSGEILRQVVEIVQPKLQESKTNKNIGKVIIGTVSGDIHDLGKNMVNMLLSSYGFTVIDLGVDVPPEKFLEVFSSEQPQIVGLSGLITSSFDAMKKTVELIRQEAAKNDSAVSIIIGGNQINEEVNAYIGADHWVNDAMDGVRFCQTVVQEFNSQE